MWPNDLCFRIVVTAPGMSQEDDRYVCDICGDAFDTEGERKEHIFAAHEVGEDDS